MGTSKFNVQNAFLNSMLENNKEDAETCFRIIYTICSKINLIQFKSFLENNAEHLKLFLVGNLAIRKLIHEFTVKNNRIPTDFKHAPTLMHNIAAMLNIVRDSISLDSSWEKSNYDSVIEDALQTLSAYWLEGCNPQIACLEIALKKVLVFLKDHKLGASRIIIVELPVGNSIPVKLLNDILLKIPYTIITVRIALSRNDSRTIGITREQLIDTKLTEINLSQYDLVIYFDEWLTGANFYNLSNKISKTVDKKKAFLIPIAAMSANSIKSQRYTTFIDSHNRIANKIGLNGTELRIAFPMLNPGAVKSEQTFFWSESDRLAGYRKIQHIGSILGSIFIIVEQIKTDPIFREAVRLNYLKEIIKKKHIDDKHFANVYSNTVAFDNFFDECYLDFIGWKKEIEHIYHESNLGISSDCEKSLIEICQIISTTTKGRKAKACVMLSILWQKAEEIDPRDQYYFNSHIPVISVLPYGQLRFHKTFYSKLKEMICCDLAIG